MALHVVAEAQKLGGEAVFIDVEHALDPVYAEALGVNIETLLVSQPDTGEQALEICEALVRSGAVDVVVVDSVAAMVTRAEIEGDMGSSHVGVQARLMSQGLRKLTGAIGKSNCVVIFINQLREKIGVVCSNPETTPGGRLSSSTPQCVWIFAAPKPSRRGRECRQPVRVKVVKNKVAPPFKEAEMDIMYGEGISKEGELLDIATKYDIILKSGSWFSYKDQRLGQGRDNVKEYIKKNPELFDEISELVRAELQKAASERGAKKTAGKAATAAGDAATPARAAKKSAGRGSAAANIDISADDLDK